MSVMIAGLYSGTCSDWLIVLFISRARMRSYTERNIVTAILSSHPSGTLRHCGKMAKQII